MDVHKREFLSLPTRPARVSSLECAYLLGIQEHDVPVLARHGLIRPLGKPAPSAPKFYSSAELEEKMRDTKWLHKVTEAIQGHWRAANASRTRTKG